MSSHLRLAAACGAMFSILSGFSAFAQSIPADLVYTPITPCPLFDTRASSPIPNKQSRSFAVTGATNMTWQGGPAAGCGVPLWARAVTIGLTAVNPSGGGNLKAYPSSGDVPSAIAVTYQQGAAATSSTVSALSPTGWMSVFATTKTHVFGVVTGYFAPRMIADISRQGAIINSTGRVKSATRTAPGVYTVKFDRPLTGCTLHVTSWSGQNHVGGFVLNSNADVASRNLETNALTDESFSIEATC